MINIPALRQHEGTIKRGHYGLLDANVKLGILSELVNQVLETGTFRETMDELMEQRQALGASRREEALEEGRRRREEKERLKAELESNGIMNGHHPNSANGDVGKKSNGEIQNGDVGKKSNGKIESSRQNNPLGARFEFIKCTVMLALLIYVQITFFCLVVIASHFFVLKINLQWDQAFKFCF